MPRRLPRQKCPRTPVLRWSHLCSVLLLTGCTTVVTGHSEPADHNGPLAVPKTALSAALLDGDELDELLDASGIEKQASREDLTPDSSGFSDRSCLAPWQPIQESVYASSGWSSLRAMALHDGRDSQDSQHLVVEAVVAFPARSDARKFFDNVKPKWEACADQHVSSRSDGEVSDWDFGAVNSTDNTLSVTRNQRNTHGWGCQRALRATNNVVVDVLACAFDVDKEGVKVVDAIDAKLPSI